VNGIEHLWLVPRSPAPDVAKLFGAGNWAGLDKFCCRATNRHI
jgi:hypothetical protein